MPIFVVPDSNGERELHEANDCHNPAGSPVGGQFCSKDGGSRAAAQLANAAREFDQPEWFTPGAGAETRVVWGVKRGDVLDMHSPAELDVPNGDHYDALGAIHVGDTDYWANRLAEDYDRDRDAAQVIKIRSLPDDVLVDDFQYVMDPEGGDKAVSNILLSRRKYLRYGKDWVFDDEDFVED